jgi:hypothetical protein
MFGDVASKVCVVAAAVSALVLGCRRVETTLCPELATKVHEAEARATLATASQEEIRRVASESVTSCQERLRVAFEPQKGSWAMYNNLTPKVPTLVINAGPASGPTCNTLLTYHPRTDRGLFYCAPLGE